MDFTKIKTFREKHSLSLEKMAERITAVLEHRPFPPQAVSRQLVWLWEQGRTTDHTFVILEILRNNEGDPELAALAAEMLDEAAANQ